MNNILEIKNLNKKIYKKEILKNINLTLSEGKIMALLGPNGSGKTSLLKIIASLSHQNSGEILINGEKPGLNTKKYVSFLSDMEILPTQLNIKQAINLYKSFFEDFDVEKSNKLLNDLNLDMNQEISTLSKGMKEKFYLILCLSRNAKLYILDEPIAGVDILTREEILNIIIENIHENAGVIITTHLIDDIEHIFDEIAFINDGNIIGVHNAEDIRIKEKMTVSEFYKKVFRNGGNLDV
ncbi:ATP-binding cassette domain-containing protein [Caviibacter abscessus]|uniref:ATP-binding cassette domain-containing protein n=1 Tax=Caviibacter abscessus TaxID=1766719 RepID=UPI00082EAF56|nr:ABC transporter ATP-binding protein [Caviibacter abscessus]